LEGRDVVEACHFARAFAFFRLLGLGGGITKTNAGKIVPEAILSRAAAPAPVAVAPKTRHAAKKTNKKSAPLGSSKRAKRGYAPRPASPTPSTRSNFSETASQPPPGPAKSERHRCACSRAPAGSSKAQATSLKRYRHPPPSDSSSPCEANIIGVARNLSLTPIRESAA
jgi:hypothetical protein